MDDSGGNDESQLNIQGSYEPNTDEVVEEEAVYDDFHLAYEAGHEPHTDLSNPVAPQHEGQCIDHEFMQGSLGNMPEGVGGRRNDLPREHHRLPSIEIDEEVEGAIESIRMQTDDILSDDLMAMKIGVEEFRPRQRPMYQIHNPNAIGPGARIDAQSDQNNFEAPQHDGQRNGHEFMQGSLGNMPEGVGGRRNDLLLEHHRLPSIEIDDEVEGAIESIRMQTDDILSDDLMETGSGDLREPRQYLQLFEDASPPMRRPDLHHALGAPLWRKNRSARDLIKIVRTQMGRPPVFVTMAEGIDDSLATERVPLAAIDVRLYDALSTAILHAKPPNQPKIGLADADEAMQRRLAFLYHSGHWAVSRHYTDAYIGEVDTMLVYLPTRRFLPRPDFRNAILKMLITLHKNDKNPVGCALEVIRKNYVGFPMVTQLRRTLKEMFFPTIPRSVVRFDAPVPDETYDVFARAIAGEATREEMADSCVLDAIAAASRGDLISEYQEKPCEFLEAGWRIRERITRRIIPKRSEVAQIHNRMLRVMSSHSTLDKVCAALNRQFVGVANESLTRLERSSTKHVHQGHQVQFPLTRAIIGTRAMQYVQIDIISMQHSMYPNGEYVALLMVTDLYSSFAWALPLYREAPDAQSDVEGVAVSSIMKHLGAVFSSFGPPEAYRSSTNQLSIHNCMTKMAIFFKINLRDLGIGPALPSHQRIREDAYSRADRDLGDRNRWVETSSFAAISHNRIAANVFDCVFSPFEVMFGRRPWRDVMMEKEGGEAAGKRAGGGDSKKGRIPPPWLTEIDPTTSDTLKRRTRAPGEDAAILGAVKRAREEAKEEEDSTDSAAGREGGGRELEEAPIVDTRRTIRKELQRKILAVGFRVRRTTRKGHEGKILIDPGTQMKYAVGDPVYIRNPHFDKRPTKQDIKDARTTYLVASNTNRFFRGTIAEVDEASPCFPYRAIFFREFAFISSGAPALWPSLVDDLTMDAECSDSWCAPWDVAPANDDLRARRSSEKVVDELGACVCAHDDSHYPLRPPCEQPRERGCDRKMAQGCCLRDGGCAVHRPPIPRQPPRTAAPNVFQGGRTVPIVPYSQSPIASSSRGRVGGGGVRRGGEGGGLLSSSGRPLRLAAPNPGRFKDLARGGQRDTPRPLPRGGANLLNLRMGRGPERPRKFAVTPTRPLIEGKQDEESDSTSAPAEEDEQ